MHVIYCPGFLLALRMNIAGEFKIIVVAYIIIINMFFYNTFSPETGTSSSENNISGPNMKHRSRSVVKSASALGLSLMVSSGDIQIITLSIFGFFSLHKFFAILQKILRSSKVTFHRVDFWLAVLAFNHLAEAVAVGVQAQLALVTHHLVVSCHR